MSLPAEAHATMPAWNLADIDFSRVEPERVRGDERLFHLLIASSFIESGAGLYTQNLVRFFDGDDELGQWLRQRWESEELQHGRALRAYVEHVWPDFPWQVAYDDFFREYSALCVAEELESTRAQELAARCVVETGTASLYRAIHACTDEPVLREITDNIRRDEVGHYKYFYRFFLLYRARQRIGRGRVLAALTRRLLEMRNSDAEVALRHVINHTKPQASPEQRRRIVAEVNAMVRSHLPIQMTISMLIKPLELGPRMQKVVRWPLEAVTQVFLRAPL